MSSDKRVRLHSLAFLCLRRVFALLLAGDALRVLARHPDLDAVLHGAAFLLLAYLLWFRTRALFARSKWLEVVGGGALRQIPWESVVDIREAPWMSWNPPWHPKLYQLDLVGGESFEFVGRRDAREVVRRLMAAVRI